MSGEIDYPKVDPEQQKQFEIYAGVRKQILDILKSHNYNIYTAKALLRDVKWDITNNTILK